MSDHGLLKKVAGIRADQERQQGRSYPVPDDNIPGIPAGWLENQRRLAAPVLILDSELTIIWRNEAFRRFRETEGLEYRGRPIYALFTTFAEHEAREKLIESLRNPKCGFGWHGEVVGRGPKGRQFVAKLEIGPTESCGKGLPGNYRACLHDETEVYKTKTQRLFYTFLQGSLLKDEDTGNHVGRVNAYSRAIAAKLKGNLLWIDMDDDYIEDIGILAAFHDVGKFGTPDSIIQKPGKLTEEEWQAMKEHPIQGAMLLAAHPNPMVRDIARSHHERWDGSGYPYGLEKEDIPLSARIVAIADVYDALRTRRAYKEPFTEEQTCGVIISESGTHFDPDLIEIFKEIRTAFGEIFTTLADKSGSAVNPPREV
jgi:putative two-component system response regulator